jgi:glycosyltransferase involved in cell wall biosynthesis
MEHYRILHMTSSLRTGGAENHLLSLCRWLRASGHASAVCTLSSDEEGLEALFVEESVPLFRLSLGSLRALPSPRVASALGTIRRSFEPQLLHAHLFHAEVAAAYASILMRIPVVATRHSAGLEFGGWRRHLARVLARRFAACIAVSEEAAEEASSMGCPRGRVEVIPNAVDPVRFRPLDEPVRARRKAALAAELFPDDRGRDIFLVGSAGGLKAVKNFPLLLRAASRILAEETARPGEPAVRVAIFGEGDERGRLAALARDLGIAPFVALPGGRGDLEDVYPLLDVFVLPSVSEGVPLALLEAMSSGVSCVASDVGGVGRVLEGAGILVPSGDEAGFEAAVRRLGTDAERRSELGRLARVRVLERYNVDIWGERILAVYRSVLGGDAAGSSGGGTAGSDGAAGAGRATAADGAAGFPPGR